MMLFQKETIFKSSGSFVSPSIASIILSLVMLVSTLISNIFIDKVGRKVLLGASSIGCFLSLLGLATFFFLKEKLEILDLPGRAFFKKYSVMKSYVGLFLGWIPVFSLVLFVLSFSMGLGPLPWIVMAEIFPGKIRGVASSFVTSFNWGCGFIVAKTFVDIQVPYFCVTTFSLLL